MNARILDRIEKDPEAKLKSENIAKLAAKRLTEREAREQASIDSQFAARKAAREESRRLRRCEIPDASPASAPRADFPTSPGAPS
jgi:hypothetical protein